jgi:CubicO group peptidase (beta-lactamase class C family)
VPLWDINVLEGAGGLRSTVNDMLKFLAANLEFTDTPLKAAMRRVRANSRDTGMPGIEIAMGWHIRTSYDRRIIWHNGGTGGYRTFTGFDPAAKTGVVVLCNTSFDIDEIGLHALESKYPLANVKPTPTEIKVESEVLQTYVGEYPLAPTFVIRITRDGSQLFSQATGQPRVPIFPSARNEFFLKVVDAQITFTKDDTGKVNGLVLHQGGKDQKASRQE